MNIAQAYCSTDREQSIRWQEQIKQWGGMGQHKLFILRAFDCEPIPEILPFTPLTDFAKVTSDWSTAGNNGNVTATADAAGPNSMWRAFARYFHSEKLGPWFFVEPDCVPLFPDSFDRLEMEYRCAGKPFMGAYVSFPVPHITGCSVYPEEAALNVDLVLPHRSQDRKREIAFDLAGGQSVLPEAHLTNLIQHVFRAPPFNSRADFDARVDKRALFYHSCKDGSIYQFLNAPPSSNPIEVQTSAGPVVVFTEPLDPTIGISVLEVKGDRAAKARAALAAKRATGWKPGPYKKRRLPRAKAKG